MISKGDRIRGSLMAGAIGDALGYEVEFTDWDYIVANYGGNGICDLALNDGRAVFSDDTQMTLFTCEGMTYAYWRATERGAGADVSYYIYQAYLCWLRTQGLEKYNKSDNEPLWAQVSELLREPGMNKRRAPGNTCISALSSPDMGTLDKPINNSKGCGGVMRTAPLGFTKCWGEPVMNGAKAAAITHGHPGGWMPAGMTAYHTAYHADLKPPGPLLTDPRGQNHQAPRRTCPPS